MDDMYVVKSRRMNQGVEVSSVLTRPAPHQAAKNHLDCLNEQYQNPGNLYIEKWEPRHG